MVDYVYRNHIAPMAKLWGPNDDSPIPLNCTDIQIQTKTSIDAPQEATIDDYLSIDGGKSLSEPWIGVTRFMLLKTNPQKGRRNRS